MEKIKLKPGIHEGLDFEDYIRVDAINHSTLSDFDERTPFHYKWKLDNEGDEPEKGAFKEGRAIHKMILESENFDNDYIHEPADWRPYKEFLPAAEVKKLEADHSRMYDGRTKASKIIKDVFNSQLDKPENKGKEVIPYSLYDKCVKMNERFNKHPFCKKIFKNSRRELTAVWKDEFTGLLCKGRIDIDNEGNGYFADLKKTRSTNPFFFATDCRKFGYYSQMAFYADGLTTLGHKDLKAVIIIAIEDFAPYYIQPFYFKMDSSWILNGRARYRKIIEKYHYCLSTGDWHGYYDQENDSKIMYELPEINLYDIQDS